MPDNKTTGCAGGNGRTRKGAPQTNGRPDT